MNRFLDRFWIGFRISFWIVFGSFLDRFLDRFSYLLKIEILQSLIKENLTEYSFEISEVLLIFFLYIDPKRKVFFSANLEKF